MNKFSDSFQDSINEIYKMSCVAILKLCLKTGESPDSPEDLSQLFKKLSESKNKENKALALLAKRVQ
jgi:capsular polysaccharide biosynthesis protein